MIPIILHAMTPHHLTLIEEELPSNLENVPTLDDIPLSDRQIILPPASIPHGARTHRPRLIPRLHIVHLRRLAIQLGLPSPPLRGFQLQFVQLRLPQLDAVADCGDLPRGPGDGGDFFHVLRSLGADVHAEDHAEALEEGAAGLGVDGEGTACFQLVERDEFGVAAADDENGGRRWDREVFLHRDVVADRFEVGLTRAAVEVADEDD